MFVTDTDFVDAVWFVTTVEMTADDYTGAELYHDVTLAYRRASEEDAKAGYVAPGVMDAGGN